MLERALFTFALPVLLLASSAKADPIAPTADSSSPSGEVSTASPGAYLHDGFYFREAAGLSFNALSANGPSGRTVLTGTPDQISDGNVLLLVGGTPVRGLALGGGIQGLSVQGNFRGGSRDGRRISADQITLGPFIDFYPDPKGGWHIGAQAGLSGALLFEGAPGMSLSLGGTIFGGYDWFIAKQVSIGVLAMASGATPSSLVDTHGNDTGYRIAPLSGSLAFTLVVH